MAREGTKFQIEFAMPPPTSMRTAIRNIATMISRVALIPRKLRKAAFGARERVDEPRVEEGASSGPVQWVFR